MIMRRMSAPNTSPWPSRVSAFLLAALAAGSAVAWGLKLREVQDLALPPGPAPMLVQVDAAVVARALGASDGQATPQASASLVAGRMVLVGVVAHPGKSGAALIAIDGKAPKPVAVGARVDGDWVLASVAPRRAVLRSAADTEELTLEMPVSATLLQKSANSP